MNVFLNILSIFINRKKDLYLLYDISEQKINYFS